MARPHIVIEPETMELLKRFALKTGKKISHVGNEILKKELDQHKHELMETEGSMEVEPTKRPKTLIEILKNAKNKGEI